MPGRIRLFTALPAATLILLSATGLAAQMQEAETLPPDNRLSIPVTQEQARAEIIQTRALNRAQAEFAARQNAENAAAKQAFENAIAERETIIARQRAEHEAQVAAFEAEVLRRERAHAAAMAQWRADVAACEAGETSRCAQPQTP